MAIVETPAVGVKQMEQRLAKMVEEFKSEYKDGFSSGEHRESFDTKMSAIRELGGEIKAVKEANGALKDAEFLLSERESKEYSQGPGNSQGGETVWESRVSSPDMVANEKALNPFKVHDRIAISGKAQGSLTSIVKYAAQTKAINEGTSGAGGYLVVPAYLQDLFAATRRQGNAFRRYGLLRDYPIDTNSFFLPRGSGSASVGWVAENTTKPSADQAFTQLQVNVYTLAGISKASLQMVQDANPTVAALVSEELGSLIGNAEEQAIISGSGTAQPKGILNISGLASNVTNSSSTTQTGVIDEIITAIAAVAQAYYTPPTAIVMHPRRLGYLMKGKDSQNNYLFNPAGAFRAPGGLGGGDVLTALNPGQTELFGIPVCVTTNMPTNLTGGAASDAIIVGNFTQALWFQRQDLTMDSSDVAGTAFESNQVWYRLEERAAFTAERYPSAFAVVTGNTSGYTAS